MARQDHRSRRTPSRRVLLPATGRTQVVAPTTAPRSIGREWEAERHEIVAPDPTWSKNSGGLLPGGQTPCILNISAVCDPMTRRPCNPMLPPSRSTSAGHPVALDTALLPLSCLPPCMDSSRGRRVRIDRREATAVWFCAHIKSKSEIS